MTPKKYSRVVRAPPGLQDLPLRPAHPGWEKSNGADAAGCWVLLAALPSPSTPTETPATLTPPPPNTGLPFLPRHPAVPRRLAFPGGPKGKRMGGPQVGGSPCIQQPPLSPPRAILTSAPLGPCGPRGPGAPGGPCGEYGAGLDCEGWLSRAAPTGEGDVGSWRRGRRRRRGSGGCEERDGCGGSLPWGQRLHSHPSRPVGPACPVGRTD